LTREISDGKVPSLYNATEHFLEPEMKQIRHNDRLNSSCPPAGAFAPVTRGMLEERLVSGRMTMA
jgi:hypothetical protein